MKSYKLLIIGAALAALSIILPLTMPRAVQAQGNTAKEPLPVAVFQAAGPNAASILSTVEALVRMMTRNMTSL